MKKYTKEQLEEEARKERNAYLRKWRKENKDKVKKYNKRYWEKKAIEAIEEEKEA